MRVGRALRERRPSSRVFVTSSAWETLIVDITAPAAGIAYRADDRYKSGRHRMLSRKPSLSPAAYIGVQMIRIVWPSITRLQDDLPRPLVLTARTITAIPAPARIENASATTQSPTCWYTVSTDPSGTLTTMTPR